MKKLYFLLFCILISGLSFGQVFITEIADPNNNADARYIELYNAGASPVDFTEGSGWQIDKYLNASATVSASLDLTGIIPAGGFYIIAYNNVDGTFASVYGFAPDQLDPILNGVAGSNGDDDLFLVNGADVIVDAFGTPGIDNTTTCAEYEDGRAERKPTVTSGSNPWNEAEWNIWADSPTSDSCTSYTVATQDAPGDFDPGSWIGTNTDPTLSLSDGPGNGDVLIADPETVNNANIDFATTNFNMSGETSPGSGISDGSEDGFIIWSIENTNGNVFVDGGSVFTSNDSNVTYPVNGLIVGETYFFRAELVDNSGNPLSTPVVYSFTFTIATYTDVPDLATLRAQVVGPDLYYRVTGPVINTWTIPDFDLTMYFQDGTAGIMVYDIDYATSPYNTGDAVSNIRGRLDNFNSVLQLIPSDAGWGAPTSTGNSPAIPTVTIATLLSNWEDYESELVRINGATFADAGGTFVSAIGSTGNYNITDATGTTIFRSAFSNANYIGQTIPSGNQDLVVIVSEFFGTVQVTSRGLSDITLDTEYNEIEGFSMYPNPTSLGYVNISSRKNAEMNVTVFDVLGKQVITNTITDNKLDVSTLKTGIYIMKVSQEDAISTQKLVIR
ncbi:T9SS type A sorting domain-containing protein [Litoribaculum gwangyangense]|uniref:LTD domain-containing protein n=1 Tax=Litoribaculum gwangyangense TaxID=1130722 RepID=A0ABP9C4L6_9FLAO